MGDEQAIQVSDLDEGDFGLLKSLVLSRGELYAAALACKLISQRCQFPIETADHLLDAVLEGPGSFVDLGEHSVSFEDAKTYLTRDLFPIENDGDLTTKLLLVFDRRATVSSAHAILESFAQLAGTRTKREES